MPILTNSQGRKLYVLRRISTSEVLNRAIAYPNVVDDAPIIGLDPDLEFLAMDRDVQPDYDPRQFDLATVEAKEGNLWHISYATPAKEKSQVKIAIANREVDEISQHISDQEFKKLVLLSLNTIFTTDKGLILTEAQAAVKDQLLAATAKLWENDAVVAQLNAAVDADQPVDFDALWAVKG